jgi:PIN domain nuclease of toxin-antitoxin system
MKCLVDTHILLWSLFSPKKLSHKVESILLDEWNDIFYSPINLWEISIKYGLGKLDLQGLTPEEVLDEIGTSFYICKQVNNRDIVTNYKLPSHHKDPFDRYLIWEAIKNNFTLLTVDDKMRLYKEDGLKYVC